MPPWINVSDLKSYDSPAASKYGVNLIPRNFLLDKQENIIARDLRGEALGAKLKELWESSSIGLIRIQDESGQRRISWNITN